MTYFTRFRRVEICSLQSIITEHATSGIFANELLEHIMMEDNLTLSDLLGHSSLLPVRHENRTCNPDPYHQITIPQLGSTSQPPWSPSHTIYGKLDHTIADILLRVTMTIIALPIAIVTSYVLYQRRMVLSSLSIWSKLIDSSGPRPREETIGTTP